MVKTDWAQLQAEFLLAHEATGISVKDWCDCRDLNYNSARRYLKTRGQPTAQPNQLCAAAHTEVRNAAQPTKCKQAKVKEDEKEGDAPSPLPASSEPSGQHLNSNGRDSKGRFTEGNPGNPNPVTKWKPGDRPALTHGGYAKFLDAEELFDAARELQLRDELDFTRARVLSVTKVLASLRADLERCEELTQRIEFYDKILKAELALDRNVARIESLERTLRTIEVDEVRIPHIIEDTRRVRAATRKLEAEAERLEKDGGGDATPVSEMVTELQDMGTGGLMSGN